MRLLRDPESGENGGGGGTLLANAGGDSGAGGAVGGGAEGVQPEAPKAPFYQGLYNEDGSLNHANYDRLPEHLAQYRPTFEKYKTMEALLGGMANMSKMVGKKVVNEPLGPDATEEQKAERAEMLRKLNGVPERFEDYGVGYPDDFPEEMRDQDRMNSYLGILHEHNAPPALVKALVEADIGEALKGRDAGVVAQEAELAEAEKSLKADWGADYAKKLELASRGASTLGLDLAHPMFKSPEAVKAMAQVAGMVSESKLVSGQSEGNFGASDREKALDIRDNPANPLHAAFHDPNHPQHEHAVATRSRFNQRYHELQRKGRA